MIYGHQVLGKLILCVMELLENIAKRKITFMERLTEFVVSFVLNKPLS